MNTLKLLNYERDRWIAGDGAVEIPSAIDGAPVATTGSGGLDFGRMLRHAREVGGPALRKLTFHDRARMIKALGLAIIARKEELYELNYLTGSTAGRARSSPSRRRAGGSFLTLMSCWTANWKGSRRTGPSSASTSTRRCRARRFTSMPSTSPCGACSRSSPRPSSRACLRS